MLCKVANYYYRKIKPLFYHSCTWGNQLVGSQILLVRLQAGIELDHYTDVFSQPLICLSGEFGSDTTQRQKWRLN